MAVCDITVVPSGVAVKDVYSAVDKIIDVIVKSGLKFEVGAMSTTVEGETDELFKLALVCHKKALVEGAEDVLTTFRVHESRLYDDSIDGKTLKYKRK